MATAVPTHPLCVVPPGVALTFNQQMLQAAVAALARAMEATSIGKGGRTLERVAPAQARAEVRYWEQQVLADNGQSSNGGVVYAGFDPVY